jgi:hypothetical protein
MQTETCVHVLSELFHYSGNEPHILGFGAMSAISVLLLSNAMKRILSEDCTRNRHQNKLSIDASTN